MTSPPASDRPNSGSSSLPSSVRLSDLSPEVLSLAKASERLIQRFGGIRPMANKLEVPVTTVQGWKKRGAIPATRLNDLRLAAQRHGIKLEEAELDAVGRSDERHADVAPETTEAPESPDAMEPEARVAAALPSPMPSRCPSRCPCRRPGRCRSMCRWRCRRCCPPVVKAVPPFEVAAPGTAAPTPRRRARHPARVPVRRIASSAPPHPPAPTPAGRGRAVLVRPRPRRRRFPRPRWRRRRPGWPPAGPNPGARRQPAAGAGRGPAGDGGGAGGAGRRRWWRCGRCRRRRRRRPPPRPRPSAGWATWKARCRESPWSKAPRPPPWKSRSPPSTPG